MSDENRAEQVICNTAGVCHKTGPPHEDGCPSMRIGPLVREFKTIRDEAARLEMEMWIEYCEEDARQLRDGEYPERATVSSDIAKAMKDCALFSTRLTERDREQFNAGVEAAAQYLKDFLHGTKLDIAAEIVQRDVKRPPAERDREGEG